jgi:hypothetical protein
VLDHPHGDLGDVEHLPPDDRDLPAAAQLTAAAGTARRLVDDHLVRRGDLPQRVPLVAGLPTRLGSRAAAH